MELILLIFCIGCAFAAGNEYSYKDSLDFSPGTLVALSVCSLVLGLILIGILSPEAIWID